MNNNIIKTAAVFLLALLMGTATNAQPNRQKGGGFAYGDGEGKLSYLDLTETQNEQLTQLRTEHYNTMKPLRAKMAEIRAKERTLLSEENVDLKEIDKVVDQQTELMNQMRKLQIKHQVAVKEVLTDEQVMKLEQRQRHPARLGDARKGHGQRPGTGYGRGYNRGYDRGYERGDRGYDRGDRGYDRGYGRSGRSS